MTSWGAVVPASVATPLVLFVFSVMVSVFIGKEKPINVFIAFPGRLALVANGILWAAITTSGSNFRAQFAVTSWAAFVVGYLALYVLIEGMQARAKKKQKTSNHLLSTIPMSGFSFGMLGAAALLVAPASVAVKIGGGI